MMSTPPKTNMGPEHEPQNGDSYWKSHIFKLPIFFNKPSPLGGSSHVVQVVNNPHLQAKEMPFGRGPTTRSLGDLNDYHGYEPTYPSWDDPPSPPGRQCLGPVGHAKDLFQKVQGRFQLGGPKDPMQGIAVHDLRPRRLLEVRHPLFVVIDS